MLTQLSTLKARLAILDTDTTNDLLLTAAINAVTARFDRETNRTLARTVGAAFEFDADQTELCVSCYPVESVGRFELKSSEAEGWVEQAGVEYLIRRGCVISLGRALGTARGLGRVLYTGGYVLPGSPPLEPPVPSSQNLPSDLEQAAVEQVAYWFQNRERLGLTRIWDYHATYRQFAGQDLLVSVQAVLERHTRWSL
jgi:hypothetical protein